MKSGVSEDSMEADGVFQFLSSEDSLPCKSRGREVESRESSSRETIDAKTGRRTERAQVDLPSSVVGNIYDDFVNS